MEEAVLALVQDRPVVSLAVGEDAFAGQDGEAVAVLVSGRLVVRSRGVDLGVIDAPGSFVGEIGALLGIARTAAVLATEPSTLHVIGDPAAFFHDHPELALELSRQLASRLHRLNTYLADLRVQYADRDDHLGLVDTVLGRIAAGPARVVEPGSRRAPDL